MSRVEMHPPQAPEADTILDFPRIDGDVELDMILRHAARWGRCLFTVAGDELVRVYPVQGEVVLNG